MIGQGDEGCEQLKKVKELEGGVSSGLDTTQEES